MHLPLCPAGSCPGLWAQIHKLNPFPGLRADEALWYQQVSAKRACPDCVGSGSRPGSRPVFCELCRGSGAVSAHHAGFGGESPGMKTEPGSGHRGTSCCKAAERITHQPHAQHFCEHPSSGASVTVNYIDPHEPPARFCIRIGRIRADSVRAWASKSTLSGAGSGMRWDVPCPACGARGVVRQEWCTRCGGDGRAASTVTLLVAIPSGQATLQHLSSREGCPLSCAYHDNVSWAALHDQIWLKWQLRLNGSSAGML